MKHLPAAVVFFLFCVAAPTGFVQTSDAAVSPDLTDLIRVVTPLDFCGEPVPLQRAEVRERLEREMLISLGNRPQVILWIKRAARYLPHIEKALKQKGMPDDLKYVAIAESALRVHARSVKGALGLWQFMEKTGLKYQLRVDSAKDERLSFMAATASALSYFQELYALFGSWTLAAAAYNMGESGLRTEMLIQKVDDYYRLYLPLETQRYLFRILSVKMILSNPARYGFHVRAKELYEPEPVDPVTMTCTQDIPIQLIAEAAKTDFKVIKDLNPEIRGYYLAAGTHQLLLPAGSSNGFQDRLAAHINQWLGERARHVYVVQKGDSLSSLAERFNVPLHALLIWNRITAKEPLRPGDRLVIFPNRTPGTPAPNP